MDRIKQTFARCRRDGRVRRRLPIVRIDWLIGSRLPW